VEENDEEKADESEEEEQPKKQEKKKVRKARPLPLSLPLPAPPSLKPTKRKTPLLSVSPAPRFLRTLAQFPPTQRSQIADSLADDEVFKRFALSYVVCEPQLVTLVIFSQYAQRNPIDML